MDKMIIDSNAQLTGPNINSGIGVLQTTKPTQKQILAAARVLANRSADACNVDRDDNWKQYWSDFVADADAALTAAMAAG